MSFLPGSFLYPFYFGFPKIFYRLQNTTFLFLFDMQNFLIYRKNPFFYSIFYSTCSSLNDKRAIFLGETKKKKCYKSSIIFVQSRISERLVYARKCI